MTKRNFLNKKVLIIGGTGSWGTELLWQLLINFRPKEVRVFSRSEHKQVELRRNFGKYRNLKLIIGDVRNFDSVYEAMRGVDIVFNLSALKHVPVCEENVWEAIQTNIHGPHNVIQAAMRHGIETAVQVSTDKAVEPYNLYGFTKGCAEKLFTSANFSPSNTAHTRFVCVRGGNVLNTTGSVVPLFIYLLRRYNKITITHKDMSRFIMQVSQAIRLVIKATVEAAGGEIYVMKTPALRITDLAEVMIKKLGNAKSKIEYIGIRPGEKLYEVLISKNEASQTISDHDYYIILPNVYGAESRFKKYNKSHRATFLEYSSHTEHQLTQREIRVLLERDGWLSRGNLPPYSEVFSQVKENESP